MEASKKEEEEEEGRAKAMMAATGGRKTEVGWGEPGWRGVCTVCF